MRDYSIEEAIEIINSCDESFMPDTKHFYVRNIQRIGDFGLIFETFLHNPLMGIIKQDYNKFRLYFEHNQRGLSSKITINLDYILNTIRDLQKIYH